MCTPPFSFMNMKSFGSSLGRSSHGYFLVAAFVVVDEVFPAPESDADPKPPFDGADAARSFAAASSSALPLGESAVSLYRYAFPRVLSSFFEKRQPIFSIAFQKKLRLMYTHTHACDGSYHTHAISPQPPPPPATISTSTCVRTLLPLGRTVSSRGTLPNLLWRENFYQKAQNYPFFHLVKPIQS